LFAGEGLLGVGGFVDGEGVVAEPIDLIDLFESDDGEGGGLEDVLAGILGGAGLALRGAGSGGEFGVGPVGTGRPVASRYFRTGMLYNMEWVLNAE